MSIDVNTLLGEAKCFACLTTNQLQLIEVALLAQIAAAGSGGIAGSGDVLRGVADPVDAPSGTAAIYYRTDTGGMWIWDGTQWLQFA